MLRKVKEECYGNLDNDITDNEKFWKTVKQLFLDNSKSRRTIKLVEGVNTESINKKIADIFNNYFVNIVTSLEIHVSENISKSALKAIIKY